LQSAHLNDDFADSFPLLRITVLSSGV